MLNPKSSTRSAQLIFAISLVLAFAGICRGQRGGSAASGGRATPDRIQTEQSAATRATIAATGPTQNCDPKTENCQWDYSFSYGFNALASPRQGGAETTKSGFAFAFYFHPRFYLEVDNDNVVSTREAPAPRVTGFGDTTIYVGADAIPEGKKTPSLSLVYGIKAPTASSTKAIGSGKVDHTFFAVIGKTTEDKRTYFEFDAGDYIAGRSTASGFDHTPFALGFFKRKLDKEKRFIFHLEVGGDFATSKSNADMYSLTYLETRLSRKESNTYVALRTGDKFGLTPNSPRVGLYLALKVGGNLKNVFK